jgi:acetyl-CoA carboxylase biotin carboxyl carrier protein
MFKFDEICELIRLVGSSQVASFELEHGGSRLRIEGVARPAPGPAAGGPLATNASTVPVAPLMDAGPHAAQAAPEVEAAGAAGDEVDAHQVVSPIVGTFYRAPNPDADPYVKVGDFVEKGQVLCIVEAMKLMNEIESDVSGTVVRVVPQNAQPVEFGAPLFLIRPA